MSNVLTHLLTDEFIDSIPPTTSTQVLFHALRCHRAVEAVLDHLRCSILSEEDLIRFATNISSEFHRDERLPNQLALAAVTVVLSQWHAPRATQFVRTLAGLQLREVMDAIGVARECLSRASTHTDYSGDWGIHQVNTGWTWKSIEEDDIIRIESDSDVGVIKLSRIAS
jgi:hypothetical protein